MDLHILELALEALERKKAEVVADIETVRSQLKGIGSPVKIPACSSGRFE